MDDFVTELKARRVLPAIGVYIASSWVVVEILDRLTERYLLSPYLTDVVFWGLFSLIPAVALVAWSYGRPGKDHATRAQKIGVPINLVATAILLFTVFGEKELGVTADRISVANEEGQTETHIVPKASYRSRIAVFFYDNASGNEDDDWLQYGATELLAQDLQQDPYLVVNSPYNQLGGGYYDRLRGAGLEDGLGAPASLLRDIALDANRDYFTEGEISREGDEYILTTRVWKTTAMRQTAEIVQRGWDIHQVLDNTALEVRKALDAPSVNSKLQEDLPLAETYGESEDALKAYIAGLNARLLESDWEASNVYMDEALELDPNFVLAHYTKGVNLLQSGDMPSAAQELSAAQKLDYRLPTQDRARLKSMIYRVTGQSEKLMDFLRLQARLRDDAWSHQQLGTLLMIAGESEQARHHLEQSLIRDSMNIDLYLALSDVARSMGDMEDAVDFARTYQEAKPENMQGALKLGDLLRDSGELQAALSEYEQAQLLESDTVDPVLRQHIIAARLGNIDRARSLLEEASLIAETASQHAAVHTSAYHFESRLGRLDASIEQLRAMQPYLEQTQPPFVVVFAVHNTLIPQYLRQGDVDSARGVLDEAAPLLQPPLNQFLAASEALVAAAEGDFEAAQGHVTRFKAVLEQLQFDSLLFQVDLLQAEIARRKEDWVECATQSSTALDEVERSFAAAEMHAYATTTLYAQLADCQVRSGDLKGAERTLDLAFELDEALPNLWVARARLAQANGDSGAAQTAMDQALGVWAAADPDLLELQEAQQLASDITTALN